MQTLQEKPGVFYLLAVLRLKAKIVLGCSTCNYWTSREETSQQPSALTTQAQGVPKLLFIQRARIVIIVHHEDVLDLAH